MNPASSFTKGLLTFIVAVSTYFTANTLRGLRSTVYFTKGIRKNISNFGPTIGVVAGLVDNCLLFVTCSNFGSFLKFLTPVFCVHVFYLNKEL